jgi:hypothetical protein
MSKNTTPVAPHTNASVDFLTIWEALKLSTPQAQRRQGPIGRFQGWKSASEAARAFLRSYDSYREMNRSGGVSNADINGYRSVIIKTETTRPYNINVLAWFLMQELHFGEYK